MEKIHALVPDSVSLGYAGACGARVGTGSFRRRLINCKPCLKKTAPKPRRKHSRDGSVRCAICSPLRCSRAA